MSHGEWAEEDTGVPQLFLQCLNPLPGPTHHSFSKDPPESQVRWRPSPQPSAGLSAGSTLNLLFDDSLYDPEGQGTEGWGRSLVLGHQDTARRERRFRANTSWKEAHDRPEPGHLPSPPVLSGGASGPPAYPPVLGFSENTVGYVSGQVTFLDSKLYLSFPTVV